MKNQQSEFKSFSFYFPVLLLFFLSFKLAAQEKITRKSVYFEAGGNGLYYSFNYEMIVKQTENINLAFRGGCGYMPESVADEHFIAVPFEFNIITGQNNSHFELGFGYTFVYQYKYDIGLGQMLVMRLGYRFQRKKQGLMYRIALTPYSDLFVEHPWTDNYVNLFVGGSIGYSF